MRDLNDMRAHSDTTGHRPTVPAGKVRVPTSAATRPWRERLAAALDAHVTDPGTPPAVTVVHGPAGSGKTTALAAWAATRPADRPVRWATLDRHDNDPTRLWTTIHAALAGADDRDECPPPESADPFGDLTRAMDGLADQTCLVLDDVHELSDQQVLGVLTTLVRHAPDHLRLVLAGRTPPVHLSKLSLDGRLREIDGRELALTAPEAEALLAEHHVALSEAELADLLDLTRGWVAGTRLAALWLAGQPAENRSLTAFPAEDPLAGDYFAEEVLGAHPPQTRQFLLSTSVCDRVGVELASVLSGQRHAGTVLHGLARTNFLVTRCDDVPGEWYRYHPLLREHLRAELARTRPGAAQRLHQSAARWFRAEGDVTSALHHAAQAQDTELVAELVAGDGVGQILRGHGAPLRAALATLPDERLAEPTFAVTAAFAALEAPDPAAADGFLGRIDDTDAAPWTDRVRAVYETVLSRRAHLDATGVLPQARATPTGDAAADTLTRQARGATALWAGDPEAAESELSRVVQSCLRENLPWLALQAKVQFAVAAALRGDLPEMDRRAGRAVHLAAAHHWEREWPCSTAYVLLGAYAYQQGDSAEARRWARLAAETAPAHQEPTIELARRTMAAFAEFDGAADPHTVVRTALQHWRGLTARRVSPQLVAMLMPTLVRMTLRVGEPGRAAELVDAAGSALGGHAELPVLHAITHAHHGRVIQARRLLGPVLAGDLSPLAGTTAVEAWLLEATLVDRGENPQRAHEAVTRALRAAEPIRAIRPFLTARRSVRDILAEGAGRFGRLDRFAVDTLSALPADATTADPLTSRELELLLELPSMRTVDEIAESMFVSANTVKTHLRGIYRKLGVRQRRDAVVAARRQGLL